MSSLGSRTVPIYQVDAFSDRPFRGNPAAVCTLDRWLDDPLLQAIAAENNLSETAFLVPHGDDFELRWFTPEVEVDLCGHATLASGYVVLNRLAPSRDRVGFVTASGRLEVARRGALLAMDLPARPGDAVDPDPEIVAAVGATPEAAFRARDLLLVYPRQEVVERISPDFAALRRIDAPGVIVSAPGDDSDFVSRFFDPAVGIDEDPVTGSAHCTLMPYWVERLGRARLHAIQISARRGELWCELREDRVEICGRATLVIEGTLHLPAAEDGRR